MHMPPHPISPVCSRHRGVTFTEVMFAVVVLGIGFIMLAAIFPVAIMQTKTSLEQTQGAALSRSALRYMEQVGTLTDNATPTPHTLLQPTDGGVGNPVKVMPITSVGTGWTIPTEIATAKSLWQAASGNIIGADDPRYAFIPLYRRATIANTYAVTPPLTVTAPAPYAQVFVFVVQNRNRTFYDPTVDLVGIGTNPATLEPRLVDITITKGTDPDTITFTANASSPANVLQAVGEGMYVVVANSAGLPGYNGHIFKTGILDTRSGAPANTYQLAPGYETAADFTGPLTGSAFIVGRGYKDVSNPTLGYSGLIQDVGCYTTFVRVN